MGGWHSFDAPLPPPPNSDANVLHSNARVLALRRARRSLSTSVSKWIEECRNDALIDAEAPPPARDGSDRFQAYVGKMSDEIVDTVLKLCFKLLTEELTKLNKEEEALMGGLAESNNHGGQPRRV